MELKIAHLSKTYTNRVKALDQINLNIQSGMFGLLGPNGAGKSTLMRTLATLQKPDRGEIYFNGINTLKDQLSLRKVLGYLPQDFGVYPKDSAEKLLHYFAILKGIRSKKARNKIVAEVLEMTNLWEVRKKPVSAYSGGMKQRFGIAQLLLNQPKLVIVDEPTAGLDPAERTRFLNILRAISSSRIIIFSTHLVEDVNELCNQMAILNQGKLLAHCSPKEALHSIKGKIWEIKAEQEHHNGEMILLSSHFNDQHQKINRVYAKSPATELFTSVSPKLEDFYFLTLNQ